MADIFNDLLTQDVTHDESDGLQTSGVPSAFDDNNDDDILLSSVAGLITTLSGLGAPGTAIGAARNQVLTFIEGDDPELKFRLFDGPDADGSDELLDVEATTLTTTDGGDLITLVRIDDYTIFGYADYGGGDERVAFALILEPIAPTGSTPGGANILIVQYEALYHLDPSNPDDYLDLANLVYVDAIEAVAFDDFSSAAAGQNLWNSVTDATTGIQLLFTGLRFGTDTVNTSDFGIGSNSQTIKIGDGIVVGFVKGQTPATETNSNTFATMDFTERVEGPSGGFGIIQTGGPASNRVGAEVWAYDSDELGVDIANGDFGADTKTVTIIAVQVYEGDTLVGSWTRADGIIFSADAGLSYSPTPTVPAEENSDDGVIIQGLLVGYRVEFDVGVVDSDDTGVLDRFSVENVSSGGKANDTFDLGDIRLGGQFGDSVEVGSHVRFEDDHPIADAQLGDGSVVHDETAGLDGDADDTASAAVAAVFAAVASISTDMTAAYAQGSQSVVDASGSSYGRDASGGSLGYALDVASAGADSGLDSTDGHSILLYKEGALVIGRISGGSDDGKAAFAIAIDAGSGVLSLAQYASLLHADGSDPDDALSIADGVLFAVVTATDGDGDQHSDSVDIGGRVGFEDDGPQADAQLGAGSVSHDETPGNDGDADDTSSAGVMALFAGVANASGDMQGYAQGSSSVVDSSLSSFGQDEEGGSIAYSLDVFAPAVNSGVQTTDGHNIYLYKEGDLVVGRIATGGDAGKAAFAVAINASTGVLSLAQYHSLLHPSGGASHDESIALFSGALLAVVTATDGDGDVDIDSVAIGDRVSFQDDGPLASAQLAAGSVVHDETAGVDGDADDTESASVIALFAGVVNASADMLGYAQGSAAAVDASATDYGADEEGGSVAWSLSVAVAGVDSGLNTSDGHDILLYKEGALVIGRIDGGADDGKAAFAIAIDASSGVLSLVQYASIQHGNALQPDEPASIAGGALFAVVTATDGDGDTDDDSVDIGARVSFQDDSPLTEATLDVGTVIHDETQGIDGDAEDTLSASVIALFAGVVNASSDMLGYAQGSATVVDDSGTDFGQDAEGASTVYSLSISVAGVDSGLNTTDGHDILLYKEGELIVGRIVGGADDGKAAFAIAINTTTGVLSLAQYASIWHNLASDDESLTIGPGMMFAVLTVTDGDGDQSSASVDIGARVTFQDDGPQADAQLADGGVVHDETAGLDGDADDTSAAGVISLFAAVVNASADMAGYAQGSQAVVDGSGTVFGQDDEGAGIVYSLDVFAPAVNSGVQTTDGHNIYLYKEGDLVVGRIATGSAAGKAAFAVAIDASTGILSLAQYHSILHPSGGASHDESVSLFSGALLAVVTATDGDADVDTDSVAIGDRVSFQDDGPLADAALGAGSVTHDESAGLDGDADDVADLSGIFGGVANVSADLLGYAQGGASVVDSSGTDYGADEEGASTAYSLAVASAGVDSGLNTTDGHDILLYKEGALVIGRISGGSDDGKAAFAVSINASSGVLSLAQYASIWHADAADHDDVLSIAGGALYAVVTATDGDADEDDDMVDIGARVSFEDDGPLADAALGAGGVTHDETPGLDGDADDVADLSGIFGGVANVSADLLGYAQGGASVVDSSGTDYGADEEGASTAYSLAVASAGVDSGLNTTDGHDILLYKEGALVVGRISGGSDDGKAAFAVSINASSGVLSLAQYASIWHADAADHDDVLSIAGGALYAVVTATDGDADEDDDMVDIGARVSFEDDGPLADAALGAGSVTHDESAGLDGDADDVADLSGIFGGVANVSGDLLGYAQGGASVVDSSGTDYGADEEGASTAYSLAVASAGVDSGLNTTDGHDILLYKEGALVIGRISGGSDDGKAAFAVSINASSGVLSLAQYASIWHADAADHDDVLSIAGGALYAVVTATDGDADEDDDMVDIGARVSFEDDGPLADAALGAGSVTHDETPGLNGDADDVADLSGIFGGVANASGDLLGYAQGGASVVDSSGTDYGADEEGASTAYSLAVASAGVDSGLNTTDGHDILLYKEGALVIGRISGGSDDGKAAFAVSINASSGVLSLAQYASIWHADAADHDDVLSIAGGALYAVVTATDGDADEDDDMVDIGARVSFEDDGPLADAALGGGSVTHDESAGLDGDADDVADLSGIFSGVANVSGDLLGYAQGGASVVDSSGTDYGADEEGASTAYSLAVASAGVDSGLNTTDGHDILLYKEGALVIGRISGGSDDGKAAFAVSINASSGVLSLAQYASIWHADAADHDDVLSIAGGALYAVVTATDGDADEDDDMVDIGARVSFEDDGPLADAALGAGSVTHDETPGLNGDADDVADLSGIFGGVANVSGDLLGYAQGGASVVDSSGTDYGADEEGASTAYSLAVASAGVDSGLNTTDGHDILLYKEGALVIGRISGGSDDGKAAFAVSINASSGVLSLAQYASIWHADAADPDDTMNIAGSVLYAVVTASDGDADEDDDMVDIGARVAFEDDGPLALQPDSGELENKVGESVTEDLDDGSPVTFADNYGEDGPYAMYSGLILTGLNDTGPWSDGDALKDVNGNSLYSNKQQVMLTGFGTNVLTAYVGADPLAVGAKVFTMTLNANGTWTMEMFARIDDGSFDFDNFATAKAGNFTWLGVAGDEYPDKDLLVTGGVPNLTEVNNDSDDLAANNQWIDPDDPDDPSAVGEFLRLDLVNLGVAVNVGGSDVNVIGNQPLVHYDANNVGFTIMQTLAGRPVDVRITAFDVAHDIDGGDGTSVIDDLTTGVTDQIGAVTVITNSNTAPDGITYLRSAAIVDGNMLVSKEAGVIKVVWDSDVADGVEQDYVTVRDLEGAVSSKAEQRDQVFVATADGFNRMEIMNDEPDGSNDAFAIGGIQVGAVGIEVDLAFNGEIIDGDGDSAEIELIGVALLPESLV